MVCAECVEDLVVLGLESAGRVDRFCSGVLLHLGLAAGCRV